MIIDFHTHLDFYRQEELFKQLLSFKGTLVAASINEESYLKTKALSESAPKNCRIIPTFGIHPNRADECAPLLSDKDTVLRWEEYILKSPVTGECGMDFFWAKSSPENQEKVFRFFLEHCEKLQKPCVIHTKGAEKKVLEILGDYPNVRAVIHWYDGPKDVYEKFIERGYYQTFGVETVRSEHIQKLLKITPRSLLLAETDNPDSEPWLGGTRNDVALIERVYDELSALLKMRCSEIEALILDNFNRLLK